ncbi:MAG: hypothetical protein MJ245_04745 [Clostridia bacterium]|nr:hypothetical protein [Clostridia bacterium]
MSNIATITSTSDELEKLKKEISCEKEYIAHCRKSKKLLISDNWRDYFNDTDIDEVDEKTRDMELTVLNGEIDKAIGRIVNLEKNINRCYKLLED